MNKIFFKLCFLLILFLLSCINSKNCNKIRISKNQKSWIKGYEEGERYILKGNKGHFDTIKLIEKIVEFTPCNEFELGPNQYEMYYYTFLSSNLKEKECSTTGIRYSTGTNEFGADKIVFWAFGLYWISDNLENDKLIKKEKIKVKGITDSLDVFFIDSINYHGRQVESCIKSFYWHKSLGLVRYETKENSEIFDYYNKIN